MANPEYDRDYEEESSIKTLVYRLFFSAVLFGIPSLIAYRMDLREQIYERAAIAADVNTDGVTQQDEWIKAYQKSKIQYDELNPINPKGLSISQLEKIVNID